MAPFTLLVLEIEEDWQTIIQKCIPTTDSFDTNIQVFQSTWQDIEVGPCNNFSTPLFKSRCPVLVKSTWKSNTSTPCSPAVKIYPDLVLIRNECATAHQDYRNKLLGFVYSEVPCMNSSASILRGIDRPTMMAALSAASRTCVRKFGPSARIPIVQQELFTNHATCSYSRVFPAVLKYGSAHAAMGKAKVHDRNSFDDLRSILPMTKSEYAFAEPFLVGSHDLRLQKIGHNDVRVFERRATNKNDWKTNDAWCTVTEVPKEKIPDRYKQWLEVCANMYGEDDAKMDILTIDVLVTKNGGEEHVLEVNGSASGFYDEQDQLDLGKLVIDRIVEVKEEMKKLNEQEDEDAKIKSEEGGVKSGVDSKTKSAINAELLKAIGKKN